MIMGPELRTIISIAHCLRIHQKVLPYQPIVTMSPRRRSILFSCSTTSLCARNFLTDSLMTSRRSTFLQVTVMMLNHRNGYDSRSPSDVTVVGKYTNGRKISMYLRN